MIPQQAPPQLQSQDPDMAPDMQLAWDEWHHRVANAIYTRYSSLANVAFARSRQPLLCSLSYIVTRDGRVLNAQFLQQSINPMYNTLCMGSITGLSGNIPLLQFPAGSRRMAVEMPATFSQNYGHEGFRYLTGDKETVHPVAIPMSTNGMAMNRMGMNGMGR
jgi:hypothetical protein